MMKDFSANLTPTPARQRCITCSDAAIEVRVVEVLPDNLALIESAGGTEIVSVALLDAVVGDRLLVHAGEALARLKDERPA